MRGAWGHMGGASIRGSHRSAQHHRVYLKLVLDAVVVCRREGACIRIPCVPPADKGVQSFAILPSGVDAKNLESEVNLLRCVHIDATAISAGPGLNSKDDQRSQPAAKCKSDERE